MPDFASGPGGTQPLLELSGVHKAFVTRRDAIGRARDWVRAVDGVDLAVPAGSTVALIGESGSGKSTLARVVASLTPPDAGTVAFEGRVITDRRDVRWLRQRLQFVFQDPFGSLDPTKSIGHAVVEPLVVQGRVGRRGRAAEVARLLDMVGLPAAYGSRNPRELSGGQRQRVAIARALALQPSLVVADEPTSALDMSTRSEILNLFSDLKRDLGISFLFISHDVATARFLADTMVVMYRGRVVERGPADAIVRRPEHPYTRALISAVLTPDPDVQRARPRPRLAPGDVRLSSRGSQGCPFRDRCAHVESRCHDTRPELIAVREGHESACHLAAPDVASPPAADDSYMATE